MTYTAVAQTWISIQDLEAATTLTLTEGQRVVAASLLSRYAGELRSALGRPIAMVVTDESAEVVGELVVTRYRPVVAVESVEGRTDEDFSTGVIRLSAPLPTNGTRLLVSYTASFDEERLEALRSVVVGRTLRALVKDMDDAIGVSNVTEEGHSDAYLPDDWTEGEKRTIDSMRRRVGAS